ncbi:hypothetical protein KW843_22810 [Acidovorax sp. sif1233]|uniref:hypothetical protein n=1 Tax=Acidovorax sp. sif1233 TaxID=2854792 RepID=UPI001C490B0D|nr:hypothetical protein [Acidovorax sp. sif1233]MBV7457330.1 hypothetical protein [Acidovorax sp. sif1233]
MTENEKTIARALVACTFPPGSGTKRFAKDMAACATQEQPYEMTPAQRRYLLTAAVRFRRQTPAGVVALAEAELRSDAEMQVRAGQGAPC